VVGSLSFVHPNSKYIGKFLTLFTTYLGWKAAIKTHQHYNYSKDVANFDLYPRDIRQALDNHDYRYARRWLNVEAIIKAEHESTSVKDTLTETVTASEEQ